MTDHTNTYPDLVNVEDWLNAKGYTGEAGACHRAMSLIRSQEKRIAELRKEADMMHSEYKTATARIAELKAALKPCADELEAELNNRYRIEPDGSVHPAMQDDYELEMATVRAARAALGEKE